MLEHHAGRPPLGSHFTDPDRTIEISEYYLELEGLLHRVESSTTYYQVLGLERCATHNDIHHSFRAGEDLLFPVYEVTATMPEPVLARIDLAFNKMARAFSVLASYGKRKEYDGVLATTAAAVAREPSPKARRIPAMPPDHEAQTPNDPPCGEPGRTAPVLVLSEAELAIAEQSINDNRRRCERFKLALPVRVMGYDRRAGRWDELTETIDVSRTGVTLRLRRRVRHGLVSYLSLPLPTRLRSHGFSEPAYNVYGLIRRIEPPRKGARVVGFEFLGERPPEGFLEKPWMTFKTKKWTGVERRRAPREQHSESVRIEYFTESMQFLLQEQGMTENISRNGMRVAARIVPHEFDLLRVSCPRINFECLAALRNRYVGSDGVERLCLQFVNKQWPV